MAIITNVHCLVFNKFLKLATKLKMQLNIKDDGTKAAILPVSPGEGSLAQEAENNYYASSE